MCLSTVPICDLVTHLLRDPTYFFVEAPCILRTIKGLLWQATWRYISGFLWQVRMKKPSSKPLQSNIWPHSPLPPDCGVFSFCVFNCRNRCLDAPLGVWWPVRAGRVYEHLHSGPGCPPVDHSPQPLATPIPDLPSSLRANWSPASLGQNGSEVWWAVRKGVGISIAQLVGLYQEGIIGGRIYALQVRRRFVRQGSVAN